MPVAVTSDDVAGYVNALFLVYIILIFGRVLMSWIPRMPANPVVRGVADFITEATNPYLNVFRRVIPPLGPIDISPMVAIFVLVIAQGLVVGAIRG